MSLLRQTYIERSSMQIVARRVDLRETFARSHVAADKRQRFASRVLILSSLAGLVLTLLGHI